MSRQVGLQWPSAISLTFEGAASLRLIRAPRTLQLPAPPSHGSMLTLLRIRQIKTVCPLLTSSPALPMDTYEHLPSYLHRAPSLSLPLSLSLLMEKISSAPWLIRLFQLNPSWSLCEMSLKPRYLQYYIWYQMTH